jgi:hypothetical protein
MCVHVYSLVQIDGLVFASPDLGPLSRGPELDRAERFPKFGPFDTATAMGSSGVDQLIKDAIQERECANFPGSDQHYKPCRRLPRRQRYIIYGLLLYP